uniref:EB domain-containing protein n=1 Tax=Caenorhabditis tropicalis TaxID=1561998 RepID=A0A1I7U8W1_9PELO
MASTCAAAVGVLLLAAVSEACLSSGVCGSSYCAAPPAVSCSSASCQPGYSCGQYGCARNRARSALTQKVDGIFIDSTSHENLGSRENSREARLKTQKNNIFGLRRESSRGSAETTNYENSTLLQEAKWQL